ncbi:Putative amidoligase enzyme [Seminavis robusta]|uniref:Amidoligase enzyme n=1 Tax=Seminavis robusta TaxID=568900 RepID=A0A9N8E393_9STRA|nr:Putative amidoligase enzyme [Seminavis robusta]|eukprot:Sro573_g169000.1 Putative amidoligase enzyme (491) ;mRNA; f:32161-33633
MSQYNNGCYDVFPVEDPDDTGLSSSSYPSFLQAQSVAFQRFAPQDDVVVGEDESAAIAAALAASEREEEERQRKRKADEQEQFARQLQREEQCHADQELAKAMEVSAKEADTRVVHQQLEDALTSDQDARQKERHVGSWDCLHCTYQNQPYEPTCTMCSQAPPPGTLVFQHIPATLRFGLELELFITSGKRDGFKLGWIAKELSKMGPPSVEYAGYSHETSQHWKIVTDGSLRGHNHHDLCFELVSPVLQGNEGLSQLRIMLEHVRKLGIATNRTCGFHCHVDATETPLADIRRIAQCFVALENAFDLLVAGNYHRRNADQNQYCRSNRIAFGRLSNKQRWEKLQSAHSTQQLVQWMNPDQDRYRKLNLTNLVNPNRPSTMEFRLHGGVQELREAEAWVRLLLRFCHNAPTSTTSSTSSMTALREEATPAEELALLWDLVNCPGLEQFYVYNRKLFQAKQLQNKWRCKRCHKPFETSRALSQHAQATGHT